MEAHATEHYKSREGSTFTAREGSTERQRSGEQNTKEHAVDSSGGGESGVKYKP